MNPKPKILIVDDEPRMCDSLSGLLAAEQDYEIHTATSGQDALKILSENKFDLALLDIMMPEMDGHQLMDHIKAMNPETYVIFLTGHASLDSAVKALRKGAYDYLKKPFEYEELLKTVQNALNQKRLKREKENINVELEISKERYRYLVQNSPDIIYTLDAQGNFTFVSDAVERLLGCISGELIGQYYSSIVYEKDVEKAKWFFNERRTGDRANSGIELRLKVSNDNGQFKSCEVRHLTVDLKSTGMYDMPVEESNKKYLGTHGVARDISDRKELESQLQHAHKMEAVGTLAGGIAHDFNNLLMGIQGYASLMLLNIDSTHPYYQKLQNIEEYVQSGAELTKQLLGFARGGKYDVKPIDLNELVSKASRMFGRTKKEVIFHSKYQEDIWLVDADHGQVEQVLLNIFVNAWHAMPGGGDLHVETRNRNLDVSSVKPFDLQPGRYVELYIADNGMGMDEKTRERIFEPFFTTKEMGRGTGLGLASAYGIIKNHSGFIEVHSKKGEGTAFKIYLPASNNEMRNEECASGEILRGPESVLFVDDEDTIIAVGMEILNTLGYKVLPARSVKEALDTYRKKKDEIDIVLLDMVMPGMGGRKTYDRLKKIDPNVKVLLSSGYSVDGEATEILKRGCNGFIQKPFNIKLLSQRLREILDKESA